MTNKHDLFKRELELLLNKYSLDNDLKTPDYILADHLYYSLFTLEKTLKQRYWHERDV